MSKSMRRLFLSAAALTLIMAVGTPASARMLNCAFCDEVCYDSTEYGVVICTQRCGEPSGPAECDSEPNPCGPQEPVYNHCKDI